MRLQLRFRGQLRLELPKIPSLGSRWLPEHRGYVWIKTTGGAEGDSNTMDFKRVHIQL